MKLPNYNHIIWVVVIIALLVLVDTLTSALLYNSGYDVSKDPSKTMTLVLTVLIPTLLQRWNSQKDETNG